MSVGSERLRLREYRLQLGWTQQELADRLAHLAWMEYREHVAVNADMAAKWERGVKGVSPRYRELLCRLFGVTADQLGAAGSVLAPHMLQAWKDGASARRTMLGLLDPAATDPVGRARAVTATVADLEQLAERYQTLHETADPAALMTSVAAHLRMTGDALRHEPEPGERRRLLRNQAQVWPPMIWATRCLAGRTSAWPATAPARLATSTSPPSRTATPLAWPPPKE
ncbi:MAG: helix-turn-helix domain-containing protein [Pseudonocardiaceae bacterium]